MRKLLPYLFLITTLLVGVSVFAIPHEAHAQVTAAAGAVLNWVTGGTEFVYGIVGKLLWFITVPLSGWIVWLTGLMIDGIINISANPDFYNSPAIDAAWSILRDVANMLFIFILIFHGIQVILNMGNMSTIKKTLSGVILAAVFINFSLFATKVVIDLSNITAAWFIQGVYSIGGENSISGSVRATLQMSKLAQSPLARGAADIKDLSSQAFATGIAVTILNLTAAYVFFQVFFLFLGRLVSFMFLLITAPIGFAGSLIDQLKEYSGKWRKELLNQALLAPVFFLMLYITLFIIDRTDTALFGLSGSQTDPVTGSSFSPMNYIMFAIIISMLLKILEISKEYSGELGGQISGLIKSGLTFATGAVAVGTIGRAANAMAKSESVQKWAANNGALGRIALSGVKATAGSGFGMKSGAEGLGINKLPIPGAKNAFKNADKGYSGMIEAEGKDREKSEKAYMESLGKGLQGAANRQAYGEYQKKGGLYGAVANSAVAKGIAGVGTGAAVGSVFGPVGTAAGAVVGGIASAMTSEGAIKAMQSNMTREVYEDLGDNGKVSGLLKKANEEFAKEASATAKYIKKNEIDENKEVKAVEEEIKQANAEIENAGAESKKIIDSEIAELHEMEKKVQAATEFLGSFDVATRTMNGIEVPQQEFDTKRGEAVNKLKGLEQQREQMETSFNKQKPADKQLAEKKLALEAKLEAKKAEALKKAIDALEAKGIKLKEQSIEAIDAIIKKGEEQKKKDEAEKLQKKLDAIQKQMDQAEGEKPEEKPKDGGDKKGKDGK